MIAHGIQNKNKKNLFGAPISVSNIFFLFLVKNVQSHDYKANFSFSKSSNAVGSFFVIKNFEF